MMKKIYFTPTVAVIQMDIEHIMELPFSKTKLKEDGKLTSEGAPTLGEDTGTESKGLGDDQDMGAKGFVWDDTNEPKW